MHLTPLVLQNPGSVRIWYRMNYSCHVQVPKMTSWGWLCSSSVYKPIAYSLLFKYDLYRCCYKRFKHLKKGSNSLTPLFKPATSPGCLLTEHPHSIWWWRRPLSRHISPLVNPWWLGLRLYWSQGELLVSDTLTHCNTSHKFITCSGTYYYGSTSQASMKVHTYESIVCCC